MKAIRGRSVRAIGEAMVEMAPVGDGLYRRGFAGDTFNTVWHMAQWLGRRAEVGMVTRLGTDRISDAFLAEMLSDGMVLDGVSRDPDRGMGLYLIHLNGVERGFHYWRDTSAARRLADDRDVLAEAVRGAGLVHLSGITLAILPDAGRAALFSVLVDYRAAGGVVSFDPNIRMRLWPSLDTMRGVIGQMLALTDIALPSLDDERSHFGDRDAGAVVARMTAAGVGEVVVKDGAGAVTISAGGVVAQVETPPVAGIRDTTGAGDAFNAGYLAGRVVGLEAEACVRAGQRLAGLVLHYPGARATREAVAALGPVG
jgi:2-dehydro-3-deoxygluconokinase